MVGCHSAPRVSSLVLFLCMHVPKSCPTLCNPMDLEPASLLCPWDFPGKNTGVGCHFLLQGLFPTQGLNLSLLHCGHILYWMSYKGSINIALGPPFLRPCPWPSLFLSTILAHPAMQKEICSICNTVPNMEVTLNSLERASASRISFEPYKGPMSQSRMTCSI